MASAWPRLIAGNPSMPSAVAAAPPWMMPRRTRLTGSLIGTPPWGDEPCSLVAGARTEIALIIEAPCAVQKHPRRRDALPLDNNERYAMNLHLDGMRVIVTAGASGIGLATARAFVREGARVHVSDVDQRALDALAASDPKLARSV